MKKLITLSSTMFICISLTGQIFVKQNAAGSNDGSSWANAYTNLQHAIDEAKDGDQIWIAEGVFIPDGASAEARHFVVTKSIQIYGGFAGTETSPDQRDIENHFTILSGDVNQDDITDDFFTNRDDNAHHIMIMDSIPGETRIDGLIFQNGSSRTDPYAPTALDSHINRWLGGGLYIYRCKSKIVNCTFRGNNAHRGSGLYGNGKASPDNTITILNSTFELNSALSYGAGAFLDQYSNVEISNCMVVGNSSATVGGGLAIFNSNSILSSLSFSDNLSLNGGALMFSHNVSGILGHTFSRVEKCTFTHNTAESGGALRYSSFDRSFNLHISQCLFSDNFASGDGGAITLFDYWDGVGEELSNLVTIDSSEFISNKAPLGGGVAVYASDDSMELNILHSHFEKNIIDEDGSSGGGLYVSITNTSQFHAQIEHTLFERNTSSYAGGAIFFENYASNHPLSFEINDCEFLNNSALIAGGAISSTSYANIGSSGAILHTNFTGNQAQGISGALDIYKGELAVDNCIFKENHTEGNLSKIYNGGGAVTLDQPERASIRNTMFIYNSSAQEGGAIFIPGGKGIALENILFEGNQGWGAISNHGDIQLINSTFNENDSGGILAHDTSQTTLQNTILNNTSENFFAIGNSEIISNGGNISSDETMSSYLTGAGGYQDFNSTDPQLGPDKIPLTGSPAIDNGNPDGVFSTQDLAGNPRNQGNGIDIGAYESFIVATKDAIWHDLSISLSPNPANEYIQIDLTEEETFIESVTIYDVSGQLKMRIKDQFPTDQLIKINIDNLSPGLYFVIIKSPLTTNATSIIIQE